MVDAEKQKVRSILDDPHMRDKLVEKLEQYIENQENMNDEEVLLFESSIEMLKCEKLTAEKAFVIIEKVAIKEAEDKVKEELTDEAKGQVMAELGLQSMDASGFMSAVRVLESAAKGDLKGVGENMFKAVLLHAAALTCTIS